LHGSSPPFEWKILDFSTLGCLMTRSEVTLPNLDVRLVPTADISSWNDATKRIGW
jgi:hypothetical protein